MTCDCTTDEHGHTDPCDQHLMQPLYAIVGPSGSGKSTIIVRATKQLPNLKIAKSLTTRQPRNNDPKDPMFYEFVSDSVFNFFKATGQMLQCITYNGEQYGLKRSELGRVGTAPLVYSVTEEGLAQLKTTTPLRVVGIRLVTYGAPNRSAERMVEDASRYDNTFINHTIYSQYGPEGLEQATRELVKIISG